MTTKLPTHSKHNIPPHYTPIQHPNNIPHTPYTQHTHTHTHSNTQQYNIQHDTQFTLNTHISTYTSQGTTHPKNTLKNESETSVFTTIIMYKYQNIFYSINNSLCYFGVVSRHPMPHKINV